MYHPSAALLQSSTPPSSWYTSMLVHDEEVEHVFSKHWVCVGHLGEHLSRPGAFVTGTHLGMPFVIVRSADSTVHAFHNASSLDPMHCAWQVPSPAVPIQLA